MLEVATKYANGKEEDRLRSGKNRPVTQDTGGGNSSRKKKQKAEAVGPAEAAVLNQGKFKGKPKGPWIPKKVKDQAGNDVMDLPCHIHTKKDEEGNLILPKHTTRQCRLLIQQFRESQPSEKKKEPDKDEDREEDDGYPNVNATLVIFADVKSKSRLK